MQIQSVHPATIQEPPSHFFQGLTPEGSECLHRDPVLRHSVVQQPFTSLSAPRTQETSAQHSPSGKEPPARPPQAQVARANSDGADSSEGPKADHEDGPPQSPPARTIAFRLAAPYDDELTRRAKEKNLSPGKEARTIVMDALARSNEAWPTLDLQALQTEISELRRVVRNALLLLLAHAGQFSEEEANDWVGRYVDRPDAARRSHREE